MSGTIGAAIGLVLLGGFLQGSFALPMKRMPRWRWENTWPIDSTAEGLIFPWTTAFTMIPDVGRALEAGSPLSGTAHKVFKSFIKLADVAAAAESATARCVLG